MAATKKSTDLAEKGIKKPSSEQQRDSDTETASQNKRDTMGTKKPKESKVETGLDHPQHSYTDYTRE